MHTGVMTCVQHLHQIVLCCTRKACAMLCDSGPRFLIPFPPDVRSIPCIAVSSLKEHAWTNPGDL